MIRYTITFYPGKHQILIPEGNTVKDAIRAAGMDFEFPCGGEGLCGKCRVKVLNYSLPPTASEMACLSPGEIEAGIRLACFTVIRGDLEIELPGKGKASCNTLMKSESRSVFKGRSSGYGQVQTILRVFMETSLGRRRERKLGSLLRS